MTCDIIKSLKPGAHVHFMGICGTAMGSLAGILREMGFQVSGSDQNVYPPMSTQLQKLGIEIQQGYLASHLQPRPDLVIVGNVVSAHFEQSKALLESDIPYTSLPKAIGELLIDKRQSLVVTGTHGKTTTTAIMAWIAKFNQMKAGFLIGGIAENFDKSFQTPKGDWFIIEGDEYDTAFFDKVPKFLHYKPRHVIFSSLEFDHADIYQNLGQIRDAFRSLLKLIPADGTLVANADDPEIIKLLPECSASIVTYGLESGDYRAIERQSLFGRNQFCIERRGEKIADVALKLFGKHNTLNALAAFAMADQLGWDLRNSLQALGDFLGVKRRQTELGSPGGIHVVEDFAHHPTAVKLTIEAMREKYPDSRVLAVFEPRSATSRRNIFQKEYQDALSTADLVFISQAFDQSKIEQDQRFSSAELVDQINQGSQGKAHMGIHVDQIVEQIHLEARVGDVVLIMSNGGFDGIYQKLLKKLESH